MATLNGLGQLRPPPGRAPRSTPRRAGPLAPPPSLGPREAEGLGIFKGIAEVIRRPRTLISGAAGSIPVVGGAVASLIEAGSSRATGGDGTAAIESLVSNIVSQVMTPVQQAQQQQQQQQQMLMQQQRGDWQQMAPWLIGGAAVVLVVVAMSAKR